ncbi:uncharacterized protein LOC130381635 [Gadus chalcogrammus]|uniref:uncharacterized protein LOC130381635 n=1 Tax=Gadus chalcogrammus TaxID=1042646 RepID=UPI0024C3E975|nr:uncharacterized protein LOC130381635 [Gadus chalcogrammus]
MAYERCPTLFLALLLCLSPWPASGGPETNHLTYNGETCVDECQYYESKAYYWCKTAIGWGYCSPQQDETYKGENCRSDHKCGHYGYEYSWCYTTNNGDYDYCGLVVPRICQEEVAQLTYSLENCIDNCTYSENYFWCYTKNSWGYCSPSQNLTYKGTPCRSGHECGSHGYSYSWCYTTDNNDYDYCGQILSLPTCHDVSRFKRATDIRENCIIEGSDYTVEPTDKIMKPTNNSYNDALNLIEECNDFALGCQGRSNLRRSKSLRIDNQGMTSDGYINLQIQHNVQRSSDRSTTLAQILVPIDTSVLEIRSAFRVSLDRRAKVQKITKMSKASA